MLFSQRLLNDGTGTYMLCLKILFTFGFIFELFTEYCHFLKESGRYLEKIASSQTFLAENVPTGRYHLRKKTNSFLGVIFQAYQMTSRPFCYL